MADAWGVSWGSAWGQSWLIRADLTITDTDILQKPVDYVLAGAQPIKDRYREWDIPAYRKTETGSTKRSGVRNIGGTVPSFKSTTSKTGRE